MGFDVRQLGVTAEIGPVDLNHAGHRALHLLRPDRLAQLMGEDGSGLILNVEITAELEGGDALNGVHEDGDCGAVFPDRQLAAGEDRPAGDTELVLARLALPNPTSCVGVNRRALAAGTERCAAVVRESNGFKAGVSVVVAHPHDGAEAQGPGFCREQKMLSHDADRQRYSLESVLPVNIDGVNAGRWPCPFYRGAVFPSHAVARTEPRCAWMA